MLECIRCRRVEENEECILADIVQLCSVRKPGLTNNQFNQITHKISQIRSRAIKTVLPPIAESEEEYEYKEEIKDAPAPSLWITSPPCLIGIQFLIVSH